MKGMHLTPLKRLGVVTSNDQGSSWVMAAESPGFFAG